MSVEMLTYDALATHLDISPEAARAVARRLGLPRSRASNGRALVTVDVDGIRHRRRAPAARAAKVEALQAEIVQLASSVAMHRAECEHERERADHLAAELARLAAETAGLKDTTAGLAGEVAALRISMQPQPPTRLGRLTASVIEADRRACR